MSNLPTEQTIFVEAMECATPERRAAYLEQACAGHPELRRRVDVLIRAAEKAGEFLEHPPITLPDAIAMAEGPGSQVGRYKLLEKIGEGGCGVVYMAEQEEPVHRRVALKIIKPGMDTRQLIARFEAERQALALMDHPNIAKVFDGGSTPTGRPYFVMELVRGSRITDYCNLAELTTQERLDLFVKVCQAVQHAHQKGIIHRDLKPSNILVTLNDGVAVPKVIDFGIAKATDQKLTDKTLFTHFHAFLGTPAYMSPEQAELSSVDIDTRSDIYSLGVLLYELLTGQPPFNGEQLLSAGLDEMRRIIRQVEPPNPSTRLSTLGLDEATEVSRQRRSRMVDLRESIQGDLDWIVMKCLEKDRARRYDTANGIAGDILRHLNNEPINARPPSAGYRFQKMVKRNRGALAAAAALLITLLLGLAGTTYMFFQAQAAQKKAAAEAAVAKAVNEFLQEDILKQSRSGINYRWRVNFDKPPTLLQALDRATREVTNRFEHQPLVEAAVQNAIGAAYANMARATSAIPHLQRALDLRREHLGPEDPSTLATAQELGSTLSYAKQYPKALQVLEESLPTQEKVWGPNDPRTSATRAELSVTRAKAQPTPENLSSLTRTVQGFRDEGATNSSIYMECIFWLAETHREQNRPLEALPLQKELISLVQSRYGPEHPVVIQDFEWLADCYLKAGRLKENIESLQEAVRISELSYGAFDLTTIGLKSDLTQSLAKAGRNEEAIALFEKPLKEHQAAFPPSHRLVLKFRQKLGWCYQQIHRTEEGVKILEQVLPQQIMTLGTNDLDTQWTIGDLAFGYQDIGRHEEAIPLLEQNLPFQIHRVGLDHILSQFIVQRLITAYEKTGRATKADALRPMLREVKFANK